MICFMIYNSIEVKHSKKDSFESKFVSHPHPTSIPTDTLFADNKNITFIKI